MDRITVRGKGGNVYLTGYADVCWGGRPVRARAFCTGCHGAKDNRDVDRSKCGPLTLIDRLAAYEDTGLEPEDIDALLKREQGLAELLVNISCGCAVSYARLQELAQAEKDGRLVVLEPAAKEGIGKPPCFYNDMGQDLCLGFARGECDDEPIDRCKECWYCESTRAEAEAALKKREEADNEAD